MVICHMDTTTGLLDRTRGKVSMKVGLHVKVKVELAVNSKLKSTIQRRSGSNEGLMGGESTSARSIEDQG